VCCTQNTDEVTGLLCEHAAGGSTSRELLIYKTLELMRSCDTSNASNTPSPPASLSIGVKGVVVPSVRVLVDFIQPLRKIVNSLRSNLFNLNVKTTPNYRDITK
jgi:hypothetical protein